MNSVETAIGQGTQEPSPKWRERLKALCSNTPPIVRMVWKSAPRVVVANLSARLTASLIPLAMLAVTKLIIDAIYALLSHQHALPAIFWWWVVLEFALASLGTILVRVLDFCDSVLADKFTRHISTRIVKHAARLDLTSYEDPLFYDMMERARVQGTDRLIMIQSAGRLFQEAITAASLAASIFFFSPWLLFALIICVVPAFLGETHFAFLGYSLNFRQTTARRQMDYLRVLGGSKENAKELKLFGLGSYLVDRYTALSDELHRQTVGLAKRKLIFGSLLTLLGTVGYYGTYAFVIYRTVTGALTLGTMTLLAGGMRGASTNIQAFFSTFSIIADQAMFMSDLLKFLSIQPRIFSKPGALRAPRPIRRGFEFQNVSFSYPASPRLVVDNLSFHLEPSSRIALVGENGQGKTTIVKLLTRLYDPTEGAILLDGVDLREYDLEDLWKEIGVIFQDFVRYDMTAAENIAIGKVEGANDIFHVRNAAMKSLAEGGIKRLPREYDQQ